MIYGTAIFPIDSRKGFHQIDGRGGLESLSMRLRLASVHPHPPITQLEDALKYTRGDSVVQVPSLRHSH